MRTIIVIAHNIRSTYNIGSLLRTAEGLGVKEVVFTGYSPYPHQHQAPDTRLPHIALKVDKKIAKTALGAEKMTPWTYQEDIFEVLVRVRSEGFVLAALEQAAGSVRLPDFEVPDRIAVVIGREVEGLEADVRLACDYTLEIPMYGGKESFNVVQAAAMALYCFRFAP
jgi:tRNA G18 (ribose-2'-O)-methylase SpoU